MYLIHHKKYRQEMEQLNISPFLSIISDDNFFLYIKQKTRIPKYIYYIGYPYPAMPDQNILSCLRHILYVMQIFFQDLICAYINTLPLCYVLRCFLLITNVTGGTHMKTTRYAHSESSNHVLYFPSFINHGNLSRQGALP